MMDAFAVSIATGGLLVLSFLCVGLHEILLSPDQPNYPNAPWHVRTAMFVWLLCLGYRAVEMFTQLYEPIPVYSTPGQFWATAAFALAQAVLLEQQLRRWLPARLHERIRRLMQIASCRRRPAIQAARASSNAALRDGVQPFDVPASVVGPALGTLSLAGTRAIGPGEGREVLADLPLPTQTPRESLGLPPLSGIKESRR
jgi:hypothetical protein